MRAMVEQLLQYIDTDMENKKDHRVFTVDFHGSRYFIKQDISNHRATWIKPSPRAAFDYEFYKMNYVRTRLPLAPEIVGLREHYFVTPDYGQNLTYYSHLPQEHPDDSTIRELVKHIFYEFGKSLGQLHDYGIAHGRPALRDIVYNPDTDQITLLDWENNRRWSAFTPSGWDLLLFIHSYIREGDLPLDYLQVALDGYNTAHTARHTMSNVKEVLCKYDYLFSFCRLLEPFHFVDTEAAVKAYDFVLRLKTE